MTVRTASGKQIIEGSDLLAAVGRIPSTAAIGLGKAGVALDERGFIRVHERLQTSAARPRRFTNESAANRVARPRGASEQDNAGR